jgi:peptide/nickel transport system substrate-binding protein
MLPAIKNTRIGASAVVVVAAVTLSGCASFEDASAEVTSITVALVAEPSTLDPIFDTNLPALNVFYNVFDQLTTIDADGGVAPRLATEWSSNDDLTEWVFTMRDDAEFSDGTPVAASDVVFTYETAMADATSNLAGYMSAIESVEATGEFEVTFDLNTPFAPFDRQVTLVPIVPEAAYTELGADEFGSSPVGSGPYIVEDWARGDTITLTRNDDYWGNTAAYETVIFTPVPDETTRANSVQSGDLDIALLGPSQVASVTASDTVDVVDQQSNRVVYTGLNSSAAWLEDVNVRKAVDLAIDRTAISEDLLNGSVEPTSQLIAPASFGYDDSIAATEYDPEEAAALIAASGYDGSPITLSYPTTGLPQIDQLAQAVGSYLEAAGLTVTLDGQEAGTYSGNWFAASLPGIYLFAFAPSVMDANLPLTMLTATGGQGYASSPEIDQLLTDQIGESDEAARAADIAAISTIVNENTYYAPLFTDTYTFASKKGLEWTPRADGFFIFN